MKPTRSRLNVTAVFCQVDEFCQQFKQGGQISRNCRQYLDKSVVVQVAERGAELMFC